MTPATLEEFAESARRKGPLSLVKVLENRFGERPDLRTKQLSEVCEVLAPSEGIPYHRPMLYDILTSGEEPVCKASIANGEMSHPECCAIDHLPTPPKLKWACRVVDYLRKTGGENPYFEEQVVPFSVAELSNALLYLWEDINGVVYKRYESLFKEEREKADRRVFIEVAATYQKPIKEVESLWKQYKQMVAKAYRALGDSKSVSSTREEFYQKFGIQKIGGEYSPVEPAKEGFLALFSKES